MPSDLPQAGCESTAVKMEVVPMEVSDSTLNSEEKHWGACCLSEILKNEDTKYTSNSTQECKISDVNNFVIDETDVEQLVEERNSLIKIAYDVCCLYMDIEKNFDTDPESADSGISEQGEERKDIDMALCVDRGEPEGDCRRTTRSRSKAESQRKQAESLQLANSAETMEAFLTFNSNFLSKTILEAVRGSDVGDLLNQLERQREENQRLEKYVFELERRRDALKLNFSSQQNISFQRLQGEQNHKAVSGP